MNNIYVRKSVAQTVDDGPVGANDCNSITGLDFMFEEARGQVAAGTNGREMPLRRASRRKIRLSQTHKVAAS